jgi:hypothetical protein
MFCRQERWVVFFVFRNAGKLGGPFRLSSWIDDHFAGRASEHRFHTIQNVSAEDAFVANEVRLQSA